MAADGLERGRRASPRRRPEAHLRAQPPPSGRRTGAALRRGRRRRRDGPLPAASTTTCRASVAPGVRATFRDAGHILGSAIIELDVEEAERALAPPRLLRRPGAPGHAHHPRPDGHRRRRRLRDHGVDLRRPRARAGRRRPSDCWPRSCARRPATGASCSSRPSPSGAPRRSSGTWTGCSRPARSRTCRCTSTRRWPRTRATSTAATRATTTRRPTRCCEAGETPLDYPGALVTNEPRGIARHRSTRRAR